MNADGANDVWGWTGPNAKEYALVGLTNGTAFVDVTIPHAPVIIGKLPTHSGNSTWRDIKVIGDYAYIVSEATGHGLQIFDLTRLVTATNLPVTFTEDGWVSISSSNRAHNVVANEHTEYIIPVGTPGLNGGGLTFYDVSANPEIPVLDGSYASAGYSHDATCMIYRGADAAHIGKEICIGYNDNIVAITDVTDKDNPTSISTFTYPGNDYCHQGWITPDHKYLLVDDELDETGPAHPTRTYVFDISNLDAPTLKYTYVASTNSIDHNLYVKGPYAYQSNYTAGLRVLNISNLDNSAPSEVAFFDNYPADNNGTFDGTWSVYPYFKSGNIVFTNIDGAYGGLHIVTPNLPHYVLDVANETIPSICAGESTTYSFATKAYSGFTTFDNITITGLPPGASATLSSNPVNPNGFFTMTVNTTTSIAQGSYSLVLTGTQTPVNRVRVGLKVISSNPILPPTQLVSPANSASEQPVNNLSFGWNSVPGATTYDLEISTNNNFTTIDFAAYNLTSTSHMLSGFDYETNYYWRVIANNNNCGTSSSYSPFVFRTITDQYRLNWFLSQQHHEMKTFN
jgi:choice-of-anchor B domain-containing protein